MLWRRAAKARRYGDLRAAAPAASAHLLDLKRTAAKRAAKSSAKSSAKGDGTLSLCTRLLGSGTVLTQRRKGSTAVNWFEDMERHVQGGGGKLRPFALEVAPYAADCRPNLGLAAILGAALFGLIVSLATARRLVDLWGGPAPREEAHPQEE